MALPTDEPSPDSASPNAVTENLAEAFKELAKGEQAANLLEANLAKMEDKLDAILAAMDAQITQQQQQEQQQQQQEPNKQEGK